MASVVSIEDDELTCSICLEVFIDPRILPCAHSFCFYCLQGWTSDSTKEITCPLCKHGSPVPTGGLKQLKSNFFVADLVKRMTKKCDDFKKTAGSCSKHPKHVCHMYCRDCELAACSKCLSMKHKRHHLVDLTEEIQHRKGQLQNILLQAESLVDVIEEKIEESKTHSENALTDIEHMKQQINVVIDGMIKKLNEKKHTFFIELDNVQRDKLKLVKGVSRDQEDFRDGASILISDINKQLFEMDFLSSNTHELLYTADRHRGLHTFQSRLSSFHNIKIPEFVWKCEERKSFTLSDSLTLPDLFSSVETLDAETVGGLYKTYINIGIGTISSIPIPEPDLGLAAMVIMDSTLLFLHAGVPCLYTYSVGSLAMEQQLTVNGLTSVADMVRFPPGESQLVISDWKAKQLHWVELSQDNGRWCVESQRSTDVKYTPKGLGVDGYELLVSDGRNVHLHSVWQRETGKLKLPKSIRATKAVALTTGPGYVIQDRENSQVVIVTKTGDSQRINRRKLDSLPIDIVCHKKSIYVSVVHNDCVIELDDYGRYIRQVKTQERLISPKRMCVNDTGLLYVEQGEMLAEEVWAINMKTRSPGTLQTCQTKMDLSVTWFEQ